MDKTRLRNRKLFQYGKRSSLTLVLGFVFSILAMLADLVGPYIIGLLLDGQLVEGIGPRDPDLYLMLLAVYFISICLAAAFSFAYNYFFNKTANKVAMDMQEDLFARLQKFPISFFDQTASGQIVSRITSDTRDVKQLFRLVLSQIIIAIIYALGIYIALALIDLRLLILGLIPLPIIIFITIDFKNKAKKYNYSQRRKLAKLNADLKEDIEGMEIIQAFNQEDYIYEDLDETNRGIYDDGLAYTNVYSYSGSNAMKTTQNLSLALGLILFAYGSITGSFPGAIGLFYIFANYMVQLFAQLRIVVLRAGELEKSFSAADHIIELLGIDTEDFGKDIDQDIGGHISFEDVSFSYDGENEVLQDINIQVNQSDQIALVGHTGSGKSTIMNLLFAFYYPQEGSVKVGGMDIETYDQRQLRKDMSIVLQDNILFTGSIRDNVSLFDGSISDQAVEKALVEVGGEELLNKLPKGIHTKISNAGNNFSSGEKQIISFARALVTDPKILVLDEATSNIDSQTEAIIQEGIKTLGRDRTMIIIAHRLSTIKHVDRIYVLERGKIVEEGSHQDLIENDGLYKEMYESQSESGHI